MPTLDLWLDGEWGEESAGWSQEVKIPIQPLLLDERWAPIVSNHIRNSLKHLAIELETIVRMSRDE